MRQASLLKNASYIPHITEWCIWNKWFKMSTSFCGQWPCPMWTCNAIYSQILGPSTATLQYELQCSSSNVDEHCNLFPVLRSLAPLWMDCNCFDIWKSYSSSLTWLRADLCLCICICIAYLWIYSQMICNMDCIVIAVQLWHLEIILLLSDVTQGRSARMTLTDSISANSVHTDW